ncbi:MAG: metallophosphoesterase [Candidatus Woesearchaeota archaeon]
MSLEQQKKTIAQLYKSGILVTPKILALIKQGHSFEQIQNQLQVQEKQITDSDIDPSHVNVSIIHNYQDNLKEYSVNDFINHFSVRLQKITSFLRSRSELEDLTSIRRISQKEQGEQVSIIGYVSDITQTKNGHFLLEMEDKTGSVRCLVLDREENKHLLEQVKDVVLDDIIGIRGAVSQGDDRVLFVNTIVTPDIPTVGGLKKCDDDVNAVFIGDLHIGAKLFLEKEFQAFLDWLNLKHPDPVANEVAKKVRYVFVTGDIIEGIGVYPNQDQDLEIMGVRDQYARAAELFSQIPKHIKIILTPGNHDTMRLAEPQPAIYKEFAKDLVELENVVNVSSPSTVAIHKYGDFPGFIVLVYHGNSFFYYFDAVNSIRQAGGIENPDLVMEFLLKRRHLAPTHASVQYIPDADRDELIIDPIPDLFATGHIHKHVVRNFKHITLMNCSCFVGVTDYQKKQGMVPDLAKVTVINLKTRAIQTIDFEHV